jgi:hypothetical protein
MVNLMTNLIIFMNVSLKWIILNIVQQKIIFNVQNV